MEKEDILKYLKDWNFWSNKIDIGIDREPYLSEISPSIKIKEIIVITGIRRCGKSTLLLQLLKKSGYPEKNTLIINLEDPRVIGITVNDLMQIYEAYLEELKPDKEQLIVLDEIQNVANWESIARYLYDNKRVNVFVTGSNSGLLSSEFASALSGRHLEYRIMPLSFCEFLKFKNIEFRNKIELLKKETRIKESAEEYCKYGGFPKVVLTDDENEKRKILASYYNTILIKDIAIRYKIKETAKLHDLARFYLTNVSKIISMNKIKNVLGVSLESVQRFSEYLENSYLICFVPKFDYSYNKQVVNPKKIYSGDLGIRDIVSFQFSEDEGRLLENWVFLELKRAGEDVYYYKTKNGLEVDFAIKGRKNVKQLIQVTKSLKDFNTRERELKALVKALNETNLREGLILTKHTEEIISIKGYKIIVKPIWKWVLQRKII